MHSFVKKLLVGISCVSFVLAGKAATTNTNTVLGLGSLVASNNITIVTNGGKLFISAATSGGSTNGIQQLNGSGTNTSIFTGKTIAATNFILLSPATNGNFIVEDGSGNLYPTNPPTGGNGFPLSTNVDGVLITNLAASNLVGIIAYTHLPINLAPLTSNNAVNLTNILTSNLVGVISNVNLNANLVTLTTNNAVNLTNVQLSNVTGASYPNTIAFPSGISSIGGSTGMDTNVGIVVWNFRGSVSNPTNGDDALLVIANWSTNKLSSGGQIGLATMSNDGSNNATMVANNAIAWAQAPISRIPALLPGNNYLVFNTDAENNKNFAVCSPTIGPDNGNYSLSLWDFNTHLFRVPLWTSAVYQPSDVSFNFVTTGATQLPAFNDKYSVGGITYTFVNGGPVGTAIGFIQSYPTGVGSLIKTSGGTGDSTVGFVSWAVSGLVYNFSVTNVTTTPAAGQTYSNNTHIYTVTSASISGGNGHVITVANVAPPSSGTLTKVVSPSGDATISYTSVTTNTWRDSLSVNPNNGQVIVTSNLNVGGIITAGPGNGFPITTVAGRLVGGSIDPTSSITATNLTVSQDISSSSVETNLLSLGGEWFYFGKKFDLFLREGNDNQIFERWDVHQFLGYNNRAIIVPLIVGGTNGVSTDSLTVIGNSIFKPSATNIITFTTNGLVVSNAIGVMISSNGNVTASGIFTGNGSGLTNLDGTKLQSGTVNSNSLDTATKAQLALAGTGGGGGIAFSNYFCEAYITNSSQSLGSVFATAVFASVTDPGGNFSLTNNYYIVPTNGVYMVKTSLRITDNTTAGLSYGQGGDITLADSPNFAWYVTAPFRNSSLNLRISHFNAGDHIMEVVYVDSITSITMSAANMTISLIYKD